MPVWRSAAVAVCPILSSVVESVYPLHRTADWSPCCQCRRANAVANVVVAAAAVAAAVVVAIVVAAAATGPVWSSCDCSDHWASRLDCHLQRKERNRAAEAQVMLVEFHKNHIIRSFKLNSNSNFLNYTGRNGRVSRMLRKRNAPKSYTKQTCKLTDQRKHVYLINIVMQVKSINSLCYYYVIICKNTALRLQSCQRGFNL